MGKLGALDRLLPVWIGLATAGGLMIGRLLLGAARVLEDLELGGISLPIAIGLLVMMYPPLAKVRYGEMGSLTGETRLLGLSLGLNWVIGPALMFALAWLLLPDLPAFPTGLIIWLSPGVAPWS